KQSNGTDEGRQLRNDLGGLSRTDIAGTGRVKDKAKRICPRRDRTERVRYPGNATDLDPYSHKNLRHFKWIASSQPAASQTGRQCNRVGPRCAAGNPRSQRHKGRVGLGGGNLELLGIVYPHEIQAIGASRGCTLL